jgi:hypothetical protein
MTTSISVRPSTDNRTLWCAGCRHSLKLGTEITLSKRPKPLSADVRRVVMPDRVPEWKGIPLDMSYAERPFEYVAKAVEPRHQVCLTGEGLGQLYVCFGAPGTGKSFLIRQLLKQLAKGWDPEWGGLLLDPKQSLLDEIEGDPDINPPLAKDKASGTESRLHIVGPKRNTNLLLSNLGPRDLGVALALAAESAGISTKEPYWLNELKRIFGAALALLEIKGRKLTLRNLAELLLGEEKDKKGERRSRLEGALYVADQGEKLDEAQSRKLDRAVAELSQFTKSQGNNADTVRSFVSQVLSPFLDPMLDYLSEESAKAPITDLMIKDGKWVLVHVPKSQLSVSRMVSALAKILFQRAALERSIPVPEDPAHPPRRIFLFVDEYAELASDLPGEGFGDSLFFSQARHFKVLSFIATQGVPMLENSGVREAWKTILSNSAGKIFFRVADPDTADLAAKLLGEGNLIVSDKSVTQSPEGGNIQKGEKLERRTVLTSDLFATGLTRGQFAFLGTTDGGAGSFATLHYIDGRKNG